MITSKNNGQSFARKSLIGWWLFDFGNSIATVIGGIYFTKWFTESLGASSELLNFLFLVCALVVLLLGGRVGRHIDTKGYKFWIIVASTLGFASILILFLASWFLESASLIAISFILFLIFLFGYQISRICHNVYLRKIIPETIQTKMSGYGVAANWGGSIFGIVLTIPIVSNHSITILHGRELTFLVAAVAFGLIIPIALSWMFLSKENSDKLMPTQNINKPRSFQAFISYVGIYFIIYFLLYDVMTIVQRNLPSFLSEVFSMPDSTQAIAFLVILFFAMVGGLVAAKVINFKNSKSWLKMFSIFLSLSIILITLNNAILLWTAFITAGISYGMLESAIRVNFMSTFQPQHAGENFGMLAIVERTSGVLGPLLWITSFSLTEDRLNSYTISLRLMAALAFLAFILLFVARGASSKPTNSITIKTEYD